MPKVKLNQIGSGTQDDPYRIIVPEYRKLTELPASEKPDTFEIPAKFIGQDGLIHTKMIKANAKAWWDNIKNSQEWSEFYNVNAEFVVDDANG